MAQALDSLGVGEIPALLLPCPRPELGDAATSAPLQAVRILRRAPMHIADELAALASGFPGVSHAESCAPGYMNIRFTSEALAAALEAQFVDTNLGIPQTAKKERVVIDFGGPNIKPMHVGHMRSLFVGESLRRMLLVVGHDVLSDIHLGDWGLPAGMILAEIRHRQPDLPWFAGNGHFPKDSPATSGELAEIYPAAAAACKSDPERMEEARSVTASLQDGDSGLGCLWHAITAAAKVSILETCERTGAHFDLTLGESDAQKDVDPMLAAIKASGVGRIDGGALVVDVSRSGDKAELNPLVLEKADGSALYATTDLATLVARKRDLGAERVIYVVDSRQSLHFLQVFRAAETCGVADKTVLEHVGFGTVNGLDGKPFRTRAGNAMPLSELLDLACAKAHERLSQGGRFEDGELLGEAASAIGISALRIADLSSHRLSGYALDVDRALSFEGRTGASLLYALVRLRGIIAKVEVEPGPILLQAPSEHRLALACLGFGDAVYAALDERSPHILTSWAFELAAEVGRFYAECPVSSEPDELIKASRVSICHVVEASLAKAVWLLGCRVPSAM